MTKWKAPEDVGGASVGGEWFGVVDGILETPDKGDYSALRALGYEELPPSPAEIAAAKQAEADKAAAAAAAAAAQAEAAQAEADQAAKDAQPPAETKAKK